MSQNRHSDDTSWSPARPFDALPGLPPGTPLETRAVLKRCIGARAAVAALGQAALHLPDPTILVSTLPVLEARANAEIENIVTTTDRLFRDLGAARPRDRDTLRALACRHALLEGCAALPTHPVGVRAADAVCSRVLGHEVTVRHGPGTALARPSGEIVYVPPQGEQRLRELLGDWERFLHTATEIDPLVRMAVAHYQFEAIHPYTDGNGRTGRILNDLFLVDVGLLPLPILHLSRAINATRSEYYRGLLAVTSDAAWEPWVLYVLRCVEESAVWTTRLIAETRRLMDETATYVRKRRSKLYSRELIEVLFARPYCRIGDLVSAGLVGRQAASRHLKELVSIGVLEEEAVGREKLFVHPRLLSVLAGDAYEPLGA